jgi:hypothetical protein
MPSEGTRGLLAAYHEAILDLEERVEDVKTRVATAENFGMDMTRAELALSEAHDKLIQARVTVHTFSREALSAVVEGTEDESGGLELAARVGTLADEAMEEREFRRQGLAVALVIIVGLMIGLVLKIRQMEGRAKRAE